jgi:uncharacterized membrane protein YkoI
LKVTQHNILAVACAIMLLIAALAPVEAHARDKHPQDARYAQNQDNYNDGKKTQRAPRNSDLASEAPTVSRSDAAAIAERATGGRVLSVRENGRYWQVQVLVDEKRVRFVNVDMRSGRVR